MQLVPECGVVSVCVYVLVASELMHLIVLAAA